jgi:site-specific recombinase XerC
MTPLAPHLTVFLRDRLPRERGASPHTCDAYAYAFQLLLAFAAKRLRTTPSALALEQLDVPLVLAFLDELESKRGNSARTRNARLAAIRSFARFLEYRTPWCMQQIHGLLAIPMKRSTEKLVSYLTHDEMQALLDAPDPHSRDGVRDRAMLHVAFAAGLRVSELVGLRVGDVVLQPQPAIYVRGKGRRERTLPLWKATAKALRAWLALRGDSCPSRKTESRDSRRLRTSSRDPQPPSNPTFLAGRGGQADHLGAGRSRGAYRSVPREFEVKWRGAGMRQAARRS